MNNVAPYIKDQQMADNAELLRAFLTNANGCGLESLDSTKAQEIATTLATAYPVHFTLDAGLEGLRALQGILDTELATPMSTADLQHAQTLEAGAVARLHAHLIRDHVATMRAGNETLEDKAIHQSFCSEFQEFYPEKLKDTGLEAFENLAAGLEGMADIIEKANADNGTNGAVDWDKVFDFANTVASHIVWRAYSPKGLARNRYLAKGAVTLLRYADMERMEAERKHLGMPVVVKSRGVVMDKNIMLGECARGMVGVMSFYDTVQGRAKIMEVEELYLLPDFRTPENLEAMRIFIRTVARSNGYVGARITIPGGVEYLEALFSGEDYCKVNTVVTTKAY